MMMWKIVGVSKVSVLYIYIYIDYGSFTPYDISFNHVDHYKLSRKFVVNTHDA